MKVSCGKLKIRFLFLLGLMGSEIFSPEAMARSRNFLFSLPIISVGHEGITKAEYNLMSKASVGLEWSLVSKGELLREKELEAEPNDSLTSQGQEFALTFSRFSRGHNMSGLFWTLGAGFRRLQAQWRRSPFEGESNQPLDGFGKANHNLDISGTALSGRVGYRFVGEEWGVVAGIYLGVKHFQNRVSDVEAEGEQAAVAYSPLAHSEKQVLKRRLMSSLQPGIELGWAF